MMHGGTTLGKAVRQRPFAGPSTPLMVLYAGRYLRQHHKADPLGLYAETSPE